ncbi:iron-sulfur cluster assembly accessory protein [archaeon]|jgi:iron-sulfur cluster assembly protein|nr:iron-sulfur cluster assembly accessory protein [archaeon]MBT4352913.1 iron-sulfur cluster assembly accessory protein [archaeon]MBT4648469.1 iron-sulfur cluster assembly accessory protein [archaeon]MBT6821722.1 iron-sulfur cluster assembly accessory protein [archaeon]MBT7391385.1 iron-sulfur cluster assembly accessory protein [archaeon]
MYVEKDIKLFIDKDSIPLLNGVKIDYLDGLQDSGFNINNPNSKGNCGCGSSFH